MITIESVLSKRNQKAAFAHFSTKKSGAGIDNIPLSELSSYWELNREYYERSILTGMYSPGLIMEYEIVNCKGKKRTVTKMNTIDRFVSRLLAQKLNEFYNPLFLRDSCAYQHNKGIQTAVERARIYIEAGMEYVVEIDIKNFFDEISLEILESLL